MMLDWLRRLFGRRPVATVDVPMTPVCAAYDDEDANGEETCPACGNAWWEHDVHCSFDPLGQWQDEDPPRCDVCAQPESAHVERDERARVAKAAVAAARARREQP